METKEIKRLCDKETFLKMKEYQKLFPAEIRAAKQKFKQKNSAVDKELKEFFEKKGTAKIDWEEYYKIQEKRRFSFKWNLDFSMYAREFNIVYGMVRGKSYKQIEPKVKEGNVPSFTGIEEIVKFYKLNLEDFIRITPSQWPQYPNKEMR